jgi:hypothetical protein
MVPDLNCNGIAASERTEIIFELLRPVFYVPKRSKNRACFIEHGRRVAPARQSLRAGVKQWIA